MQAGRHDDRYVVGSVYMHAVMSVGRWGGWGRSSGSPAVRHTCRQSTTNVVMHGVYVCRYACRHVCRSVDRQAGSQAGRQAGIHVCMYVCRYVGYGKQVGVQVCWSVGRPTGSYVGRQVCR